MADNHITFFGFAIKTIVAHTITYFLMGIIAFNFLDYERLLASPYMVCWFRQLDDPVLMAGPLFQPVRGLVFALAFYPLREILFGRKNGWLIIWWTLVALGILSTFGPCPGSIEGFIYTLIPIRDQLVGYLEVVTQALLLSVILYYWVNHPGKRWLNWMLGIVFILLILFPVAGLLTR
ncbi:MAG: hypothetical protein FVQ81_17125 [Candidatus Glassbacteria bacterium]|nr:hypothetical protein [Candidatus Glassbacteria bacterium]